MPSLATKRRCMATCKRALRKIFPECSIGFFKNRTRPKHPINFLVGRANWESDPHLSIGWTKFLFRPLGTLERGAIPYPSSKVTPFSGVRTYAPLRFDGLTAFESWNSLSLLLTNLVANTSGKSP